MRVGGTKRDEPRTEVGVHKQGTRWAGGRDGMLSMRVHACGHGSGESTQIWHRGFTPHPIKYLFFYTTGPIPLGKLLRTNRVRDYYPSIFFFFLSPLTSPPPPPHSSLLAHVFRRFPLDRMSTNSGHYELLNGGITSDTSHKNPRVSRRWYDWAEKKIPHPHQPGTVAFGHGAPGSPASLSCWAIRYLAPAGDVRRIIRLASLASIESIPRYLYSLSNANSRIQSKTGRKIRDFTHRKNVGNK